MSVPVVSIPLCGDSAAHAEGLSSLDRLSATAPPQLVIKLTGPGGLSPEAVLTYYDILTAFPRSTQIVTICYSNLIGVDLLLFLAGSPRDIRPSAWCFVHNAITSSFDSAAHQSVDHGVTVCDEMPAPYLPLGLHHYSWDYHLCLQLIAQHVDLASILDRRLSTNELRGLLLIDCGDLDASLQGTLGQQEERHSPRASDRPVNGNGSGFTGSVKR